MNKNLEEKITNRRFLAIDYGEKFIGLASFNQGLDPFVLVEPRIQNRKKLESLLQIKQIIMDELITDLVWGVPHLLDGTRTKMTEKIEKVGKELQTILNDNSSDCRVHFFDETLSTYQAKEVMLNSPRYNFKVNLREIDSLSAKIILEDFLKV